MRGRSHDLGAFFLLVVGGVACRVDVPDVGDRRVIFLCNDDRDCADGWSCLDGRCFEKCGGHFCDPAVGQCNNDGRCDDFEAPKSCPDCGAMVPPGPGAGAPCGAGCPPDWECGRVLDRCTGQWVSCGPGCTQPRSCGASDVASGYCGDGFIIGSPDHPARSCLEIAAMAPAQPSNRIYTIETPNGPRELYCDMQSPDGGGWTLVGEVSGKFDMYATWLRSDQNVANLTTTTIEETQYACIDAVGMAVRDAEEVRLSNGRRDRWVKWAMHPDRDADTWWHHENGQAQIAQGPFADTLVTSWDGRTETCRQGRTGVMPLDAHGGSYPYAAVNDQGNTEAPDLCMAVGVQVSTTRVDGFFQESGNGFDAPGNDDDWPNGALGSDPHLQVWLR